MTDFGSPVFAPLSASEVRVELVRLPEQLIVGQPQDEVAAVDRLRQFETLWSLDPAVVRDAARICAALTEEYRPDAAFPFWDLLEDLPPQMSATARRTSHVFDRMLAYFSASLER